MQVAWANLTVQSTAKDCTTLLLHSRPAVMVQQSPQRSWIACAHTVSCMCVRGLIPPRISFWLLSCLSWGKDSCQEWVNILLFPPGISHSLLSAALLLQDVDKNRLNPVLGCQKQFLVAVIFRRGWQGREFECPVFQASTWIPGPSPCFSVTTLMLVVMITFKLEIPVNSSEYVDMNVYTPRWITRE